MKTTGLDIFPKTQVDAQTINEVLDAAGFSFEWNVEFGCFSFEEDEDCFDTLESQIDEELSGHNVNYRIEGIF
jgi:hypothetical protein